MRKPSYYANVRKVPKYGLENLFRGVPKKRNIELYKIYIIYVDRVGNRETFFQKYPP